MLHFTAWIIFFLQLENLIPDIKRAEFPSQATYYGFITFHKIRRKHDTSQCTHEWSELNYNLSTSSNKFLLLENSLKKFHLFYCFQFLSGIIISRLCSLSLWILLICKYWHLTIGTQFWTESGLDYITIIRPIIITSRVLSLT